MGNILKLVLIAIGGLLAIKLVFAIIQNIAVVIIGVVLIVVAVQYGLSLLRDE